MDRTSRYGFTVIELMIVVAVMGILAAVALPSFVDYVRRSKVAEVHITLDRCAKYVLEYYNAGEVDGVGRAIGSRLPARMNKWICPGKGFGRMRDLSGSSDFIDPQVWSEKGAKAFKDIGFTISDATYACYRYYTNTQPTRKLRKGNWFRCQAVTDVDADGRYAYWYKTGTYLASIGAFQTGAVYRVAGQDDY